MTAPALAVGDRSRAQAGAAPGAASRKVWDVGLGLDLHEHGGVDEATHFNQRQCGTHRAEDLSMGAADPLPILNLVT